MENILKNYAIDKKLRYLEIGIENVRFTFVENTENKKEKDINIGYKKVAESFFKSEIPNESEVENAINYIEDEIMKDKEIVSKNEELISGDKDLREILGGNKESYLREEVEEIFTKYALLSMGQSPVYNKIKVKRDNYAKLLVLREIMHHLNFKNIVLIK